MVEDESVLVSVQALGMTELAEKHNWIGQNRVAEEPEEPPVEDEASEAEEEIAGMSLKKKAPKPVVAVEEKEVAKKTFESKKDIDREMKVKTLKALKKSKTLKAKTRQKRSKDIKKSRRQVHSRKKSQSKSKRPKNRK